MKTKFRNQVPVWFYFQNNTFYDLISFAVQLFTVEICIFNVRLYDCTFVGDNMKDNQINQTFPTFISIIIELWF